MFFSVSLQLMEVGQIGANGRPVASRAEVFKNVFEIARIQSPVLAGNLVKEKSGKLLNARIFVQTYLAVCNEISRSCIDFNFLQVNY